MKAPEAMPAPLPATPWRRRAWPWAALALLLALAPWVAAGSSLALSLLAQMGIAVVACLSCNILLGQGGMLSFGHAVYTGLGAYAAIHALARVGEGGLAWLPVALVPLAGGVAGWLVAALLGWVSTRRAGTTFAMITLGLGELVFAAALMFTGVFGGEAGIAADRTAGQAWLSVSFGPLAQVYYLVAAYTFVCVALMYAFTRTPLGRLLNAVRDNPERVAFIGFNPQWVRYLAFMLAGFFAGISGGLGAVLFEIVTAESLGALRSGGYLLFTFLGGASVFFGPVVGGVLMVLTTVWLSEITPAWPLYLGLVFMLMVMYAPEGLAGLALAPARLAAQGRLKPLLPHAVALGAALALLLAGVVALVEMLYRLQLGADAGAGDALRLAGITLHVRHAGSWLGAAGVAMAGLALTRWAARRLTAARSAGPEACA